MKAAENVRSAKVLVRAVHSQDVRNVAAQATALSVAVRVASKLEANVGWDFLTAYATNRVLRNLSFPATLGSIRWMSQPKQMKTDNALLPTAVGFTWELFCITSLSITAIAATSIIFILLANNKSPGLLLIVSTISLLLLTLRVVPWLTNKYRARQRSALLKAEEIIRRDSRPAVLYLRSFKDDQTIARAIGFSSIEQEMKLVLFEIGPFIAIADTDGEPEDPGAARMYIHDELWQEKVSKQMSTASLVIMRIGDSPGFWWEIHEAPKRVRPERLVFLIPADGKDEYEKFRREAKKSLPCNLPEYKITWSPFGSHGGIVYFEPNWTPHLREFRTLWLRQTFWNLFAPMLKIGLRPVYDQLGVTWVKPPVQLVQVLYMLMLTFLAGVMMYLAYAVFNNIRLLVN